MSQAIRLRAWAARRITSYVMSPNPRSAHTLLFFFCLRGQLIIGLVEVRCTYIGGLYSFQEQMFWSASFLSLLLAILTSSSARGLRQDRLLQRLPRSQGRSAKAEIRICTGRERARSVCIPRSNRNIELFFLPLPIGSIVVPF